MDVERSCTGRSFITYEEFRVLTMKELLDAISNAHIGPSCLRSLISEYFRRLYREISYVRVFDELLYLLTIADQELSGGRDEYISELVSSAISTIADDADTRDDVDIVELIYAAQHYIDPISNNTFDNAMYWQVLEVFSSNTDYDTFVKLYPSTEYGDLPYIIPVEIYNKYGDKGIIRFVEYTVKSDRDCVPVLNNFFLKMDLMKAQRMLYSNYGPERQEAEIYFSVLYELIHTCAMLKGYDHLLNTVTAPGLKEYILQFLSNV